MIKISLITLAVIGLATAASAEQAPIPWTLYEDPCSGGAAEVEIACGRYGRFMIRETLAPSCIKIAGSEEIPTHYPTQHLAHAFPTPVQLFSGSSLLASSSGPQASPKASATTQPQGGPKWIDVIDFDNVHGRSTAWLAGYVAGPTVQTVLAPLDNPALDGLGEVSDFHVLARLCEALEAADDGALPPPTTVNMSFGRLRKGETDAHPDPTSSTCADLTIACQIAHVAGVLQSTGSTLVGAAGNHGADLFPGYLPEVIGAGMLDGSFFVQKRQVRPAWETPSDAEALLPGNGLCLGSWAAPAGSSYSSAMLAGWLVEPLTSGTFRTLGTGPLRPALHPTKGCWALTGGAKYTSCNARVTSLIGGLTGAIPTPCDLADTGPDVTTPSLGRGRPPDAIQSIDAHGAPTHPTPESDPCVPCSGVVLLAGDGGSDLALDLSKSGPLPDGVLFDEVDLRVEGTIIPLPLTAVDLELMRRGELAQITIPDAGIMITPESSLSLWYRLREDATPACGAGQDCFWSATPLLVK